MPRTIVHIGLPKTGTTTLQKDVFARHSGLVYLGKPFTAERAALDDIIASIWREDTLGFRPETLGTARDEIAVAALHAAEGSVLLSEEALSSAGFADRREIAMRLRKLFDRADILLTIRRQDHCVPSLVSHYRRKGIICAESVGEWVEGALNGRPFLRASRSWILRQYLYSTLVGLYREVFPEATIKVLPLEMLESDASGFAEQLADFLGIDVAETDALIRLAERRNDSVRLQARFQRGQRMRPLRRMYHAVRKRYFPEFRIREALPWVDAAVDGAASRGESASAASILSDESRASLAEYYRPDNRRLCEMTGLDLEQYGYPL